MRAVILILKIKEKTIWYPDTYLRIRRVGKRYGGGVNREFSGVEDDVAGICLDVELDSHGPGKLACVQVRFQPYVVAYRDWEFRKPILPFEFRHSILNVCAGNIHHGYGSFFSFFFFFRRSLLFIFFFFRRSLICIFFHFGLWSRRRRTVIFI